MSIFSTILNKIFPHDHPANTTSASTTAPAATAASAPGSTTVPAGTPSTPPTVSAQTSQPSVAPMPAVDVEAVLTKLQEGSGQQLNWRTSIVDLLKLLGLDSSLDARKQLAAELHYSGSTEDSAAMNVWLHREVMQKLAANGGKVPDELK
ncbi:MULTISPECIES: DUF3597 domain-containing protein [Paraburkholderia]|uniref:DUF3597 domain-containing protein n=1 Tax=Paraburkholderia fynbosensis TaxID=1200993 RepID=A0A6J5GAG3_9BURK|nr:MULTISPECIES: DUF3597 domain-containing protein [Paraburkholderia]RKT13693.1 uncharacterized protein DUF3597 [Paraburkholderia sp. RAU2J]CAB3795436.1 hypothetical protein LMG27177_03846 [Paraburkholderia fynbosensis]